MPAKDLRNEAYAALSGQAQGEPEIWDIANAQDLEDMYWRLTRPIRLGKVVRVTIEELEP